MARYTEAYSRFVSRVPEVDTLYNLANEHIRSVGPLKSTGVVRALCRSGVVLLSSHIEGYVETLAEVILRRIVENTTPKQILASRFMYYFSKDVIDELRETKDPDKVSSKIEVLFRRDGDIWCSKRNFEEDLPVERFVSGFSTPRFDQIRVFVARFGYIDYSRDLGTYLRANFRPCTNMVDNVVDQRNKIAHGDIVTTATPSDLAAMLKLVRMFCRSTDVVVGNWFRSIGCPIR